MGLNAFEIVAEVGLGFRGTRTRCFKIYGLYLPTS